METFKYLKKKKEKNIERYEFTKQYIKNEILQVYSYNVRETYNFILIAIAFISRKLYLYNNKFKFKYLFKQIRSVTEFSKEDIKYNKSFHIMGINYYKKILFDNYSTIKSENKEEQKQLEEIIQQSQKSKINDVTDYKFNKELALNAYDDYISIIHNPMLIRNKNKENYPIKIKLAGVKNITNEGKKFIEKLLSNQNMDNSFYITLHSSNFEKDNIKLIEDSFTCWVFIKEKSFFNFYNSEICLNIFLVRNGFAEFDYVSNNFYLLKFHILIEELIEAKKHARLMGYGIYGNNKNTNLSLKIEKKSLLKDFYDKMVIRNNLQGVNKAIYNKYKKL